MKTFIVLLLIALFCQTSFLPINIAVLFLISHSLVSPGKDNLYLGFFAGLLLGLLSSIHLGFYAIAFLIIVEIVLLIRKSPVLGHFLVVIPLVFILALALSWAEQGLLDKSFTMSTIWIETALALPVYLLVRFLEDRTGSVSRSGIKLKL